jgi:hypothetical protein
MEGQYRTEEVMGVMRGVWGVAVLSLIDLLHGFG